MKAVAFAVLLSMVLLSTAARAGEVATEARRAEASRLTLPKSTVSKGPRAEVPGMMNYQGTLTDGDGVALDTTVSMTFAIYADSTGGIPVPIWWETQPSVVVSHGLFNVLLGRVNAIPDTVFRNPSRWLAVQVGSDPAMEPRERIAVVGYAFWAAQADTAEYARSSGGGGGGGGWVDDGTVVRLETDTDSVGIGTTIPAAKLDVSGDINAASVYKIGENAVLSVTDLDNLFVGEGAGTNNTGNHGTFVGDQAGHNNQGSQNTFLGKAAGLLNADGFQNTFVGSNAGVSNTSGYYNTFLGSFTGGDNVTGDFNTYLGAYAGDGTKGSENTFLGYFAGAFDTAGSGNVFLGHKAGMNENGSDKLYIANGPDTSDVLIYGDFSTGNMGLGTLMPSERLDVAGGRIGGVEEPDSDDDAANKAYVDSVAEGVAGSNMQVIYNDNGTAAGAEVYYDNATGNLGIGTPTPDTKLAIEGLTDAMALAKINQVGGRQYVGLRVDRNDTEKWFVGMGNTNDRLIFRRSASTDDMAIDTTGNVGIGTTNPTQKLEIEGTDTRLLIQGGGTNTGMAIDFTGTSGRRYDILSTGASDPIAAGKLKIRDVTGGTDVFIIESGSVGIRKRPDSELSVEGDADFTGHVGIGKTNPERDLHILGDNPRILIEASSSSPEINFKNTDDVGTEVWSLYKHGTTDDFHFYQNGNRVTIQDNTGNVGIGTTSPGYKLEVTSSTGEAAHFLTTENRYFTYGCKGEAVPGGNTNALGVYGVCEPADGYGWGVYGQGGSIGMQGVCIHSTTGHTAHGVYGQASYGTTNYGVRGQANAGTTSYGVYGYAFDATTNYGVYYAGGLGGSGTKSAIVRTEEGPMAVYCQESPENWFEDFGSGAIHGGRAEIELARDFRLTVTINGSYPMKVFITPLADIGRWWVEKETTGFTLMAPAAPEGAEFDFRVVAKRKGYEDLRLEKATASYADRFLYPDVNDVPQEYRDLWLKAAPKERQTQ